MRELTKKETESVAGGFDVWGPMTGITYGLRLSAIGGALYGSFRAGHALGTAIYNTYTRIKYSN